MYELKVMGSFAAATQYSRGHLQTLASGRQVLLSAATVTSSCCKSLLLTYVVAAAHSY
jgi:hypothetical protein